MGDDCGSEGSDDFAGLPATGPAIPMARFHGAIISAASVQPSGAWVVAAIRCRRRPGHRLCPGWIRLKRTDVPSTVEWCCSSCADQGVIYNWRGSEWDLSRWAPEPGKEELLRLPVSQAELRELRDMIVEPEGNAIIEGGVVIDGSICLRGRPADLDELIGSISFEMNHESSRKRQDLLDAVADRIEALLLSAPEG